MSDEQRITLPCDTCDGRGYADDRTYADCTRCVGTGERVVARVYLADVRDVAASVARAAERGDDERAHIHEDTLYRAVLRAIALGACDDPATCAKAALETQMLKFARWYA